MWPFKDAEPEMVKIKGHQLVCPVCANKYFEKKEAVITRIWRAYSHTDCYICSECNYIYWFLHNRKGRWV